MITETGIWQQEEANQYHAFDYYLAKWIGQFLPREQTIIDMGCGLGSYIKYFQDIGFKKVLGIEGTLLDNFEIEKIAVMDLTKEIKIKLEANVLCLEVGEHIPEHHLPAFIKNITDPVSRGQKLILSWAVPGQEGIGHVSCRTNEWVIDQVSSRGLKFDKIKTEQARAATSNHCAYFRETILIFYRP